MQKRLQLALMANTVIATFLSITTPYVQAETGASLGTAPVIATTDENGRTVYVNDAAPVSHKVTPSPKRSNLEYWSVTEHRWKPVPPANGATMRAARSAAAEVDHYLGETPSGRSKPSPTSSWRGSESAFTTEQINAAIEQAAARHNVDPNLVRSVVKVESNFNPNAVSRKGAMGLMQLMPSTARSLQVTNPFDPEQNVDAGVRHLKKLLENYGGDVNLTLAAYNAGEGTVARSGGIPHYGETRNYVKRITSLYYAGWDTAAHTIRYAGLNPVRVERDARGVLYISNTD